MWKTWYLFRLYHTDKLLFAAILIYALMVGRSIYTQNESIPFYIYAMYSGEYGDLPSYPAPQVEINGKLLDFSRVSYHEFEFVMAQLHHFHRLENAGFKDPTPEVIPKYLPLNPKQAEALGEKIAYDESFRNKFLDWAIRYFSKGSKSEIKELAIHIDFYAYNGQEYVYQSRKTLLEHEME